jgi:SAM-dependent methyltransferase
VQLFDTSRPNLARAHDYLLGGRHHFAADRDLAVTLAAVSPSLGELLRENRAFVCRAAYSAARQDVRQFLDLGSGLGFVHQVCPRARVAYVDNDPSVRAYGGGLVASLTGVRYLDGDLAEPEALLTGSELGAVIDLRQPVCLILSMVLHLVEESTARGVVGVLVRALAPGSYVIISTAASDAAADGIEPYFGGLEVVAPGLGDSRAWGVPDAGPFPERADTVLCGVGRRALFCGFQDEHRDGAGGLLLVVRIRRVCGDRALPPLVAFGPGDLPRDHLALDRAILQGDSRVGDKVVVPVRVRGSAALRGDHRVASVVLDSHQRCLADLAGARAAVREDHDGHSGVLQRRSLRAAGTLVQLNLVSDPLLRAWFVIAVGRHTHS